jgi:hypothetical protein
MFETNDRILFIDGLRLESTKRRQPATANVPVQLDTSDFNILPLNSCRFIIMYNPSKILTSFCKKSYGKKSKHRHKLVMILSH